jgi:hypothetical protein
MVIVAGQATSGSTAKRVANGVNVDRLINRLAQALHGTSSHCPADHWRATGGGGDYGRDRDEKLLQRFQHVVRGEFVV